MMAIFDVEEREWSSALPSFLLHGCTFLRGLSLTCRRFATIVPPYPEFLMHAGGTMAVDQAGKFR